MENGRKKAGKRKWLFIVPISLVVIILIVFFAVPMYLSSDSGTRMLTGKINKAVDGTVKLSDFSMGWFSGVRAEGLQFTNHAGTTTVHVQKISSKPSYLSLLRGTIDVDDTVIDKPQVVIDLQDGAIPAPLPAPAPTHRPAKQPKPAPVGTGRDWDVKMLDMQVIDGQVRINLHPKDQPVQTLEMRNIASNFDIQPAGRTSTFDVLMDITGGGSQSKVTAKGELKPAQNTSWTLAGTSGDFTVEVKDLDLASLKPLFALVGKDLDVEGLLNADIQARIENGQWKNLQADTTLTNIKQKIGQTMVAMTEPIEIKADVSSPGDGKVKIDQLRMSSSFAQLNCSGGMDKVGFDLSADLGQTYQFASRFKDFGGLAVQGDLTSKGTVYFEASEIRVTATDTVEQLVLSKGSLKTPPISGQATGELLIHATNRTVKMESVQITSPQLGNATVTDAVYRLGQTFKPQMEFAVRGDADLAKVSPLLKVFDIIKPDMDLGGQLQADVAMTKKTDGLHVTADRTTVTNLRIARGKDQPFVQEQVTLDADVLLDVENKSVKINKLDLESKDGQSLIKVHKGEVKTNVGATNTEVQGQLDAEYDLKVISAVGSAFLPQGLSMHGKRRTNVSFDSTYLNTQTDGFMANLNAAGEFGFDSAEFMGLNFGPTETKVDIKKGVLTLAPFETTVNEGKLRFAGTADFSKTPTMLRTPSPMQMIENVKITDEMTDTMLMYANPVFADAADIRGILQFHCETLSLPIRGASKNDLGLIGTLAIDNMRLEGSGLLATIMKFAKQSRVSNLELLPTRLAVQKGNLRYQNMQLNVDNHPINFAGRIGLDKSMDMQVVLPYVFAEESIRAIGADQADRNDRISLPLEGSLTRPKLNLEKMIQQLLERRLKEELQKGLKNLFD